MMQRGTGLVVGLGLVMVLVGLGLVVRSSLVLRPRVGRAHPSGLMIMVLGSAASVQSVGLIAIAGHRPTRGGGRSDVR